MDTGSRSFSCIANPRANPEMSDQKGVQTTLKPCRFFQQGHCRSGDACKFAHIVSITREDSSASSPAPDTGVVVQRVPVAPTTAAAAGTSGSAPAAPVKPRRKRSDKKPSSKGETGVAAENLEDSFAFMSDATFLKAGRASAASELAVAGVCWDGATTNRPGARHGPASIRAASHMLVDGTHPLFEVSPREARYRFGDAGDLMLPNTSLERMREALVPGVAQLLKRHRHLVFLGGDHSVTLPILRAYHAHFGRPLAVLHFDAHCDTWKDHFG